jgi:diguanylate cyclase
MKTSQPDVESEISNVQQMRLRRVKLGSISYLVTFSLVALFWQLDYFGVDVVFTFCAAALAINLLFYTLISTGYNLRLADPSMTMAQICVSIIPALYVMYHAQQLRGVFLLLCVSSALYGLFRFRIRDFALMTVFVVGGYALLIVMVYLNRPSEITLQVEIVQLFALFATLLQFSGLGTFIANLRDKVRDQNKELKLRNSELEHALLRIEELAMRDELTGVFNRRYLMEAIKSEKHRCERNGGTFSICILDVDHFKQVNDTYGHAAGDDVLKAIAGTALQALRQTDYFGRYGGEEFALVLPGASVDDALITTERVRSDIEALRFADISANLNVTVSIGIADSGPNEDIAHTLQRADQALYRAKSSGRNRCLVANDLL